MSLLISGKNSVELDERIAELRRQRDPSGFSTTVIDVQLSSIAEIRAACQAAPFFGGSRLVVLRNPIAHAKRGVTDEAGDESDEGATGRVAWAELAGTLAAVPESTELIVRHDGSLSENHFVVKFAKKHGWNTQRCDLAADAELLQWVQARMERAARDSGIRVESEAALCLVQRLYPTFSPPRGMNAPNRKWDQITPDARLIVSEIDKLACAASGGVIDAALVDEMVADRSGYRAFALNDQIFAGQTEQALQELENVLAAGEPAQRVIALVASELSGLAATRALGEFGGSAVAAAANIGESRLSAMASRASGVSVAAMSASTELLRRSEESEKTGRGADMQAAIVPLVAEVTESIRAGRKRSPLSS